MRPTTPLSITVNTHGVRVGSRERQHIDAALARLDGWTKRFHERSIQVNVKQHERDGVHTVNLVLELPNRTIVSHDSAPHLLAAVDRAFKKAVRQLREHKTLLRREHLHLRVRESRTGLPEISEAEVSVAARTKDLADFRAKAKGHVGRLRRFLGDELRLLEKRGVPVRASVDDLVDETFVHALGSFTEKPWALPVASWLYSVAMDVIEKQLRERHEPSVRVDEPNDIPSAPSEEDEVYDGLHRFLFRGETDDDASPTQVPTKELRVMGLGVTDPAVSAEEADMKEHVGKLLSTLPALWRRGFLLHFVEGFDFQEIAQILSLTEEQVRFNIEGAELFLHDRLAEDR